MAESIEKFQQEIESLKAELELQRKTNRELVEKHAAQLREIQNSISRGGVVVVAPSAPIEGVFEAKYKDPLTGKDVKVKVKFADGHYRVRMADGTLVSSEALMAIANGKEVDQEVVQRFPALANITQDKAAARLVELVKMKYPYLVEV